MSRIWSKEEINLLKKCNNKYIDEIKVLFPNRTELAIRNKCSEYKINILRNTSWSEEELNILKSNNDKTMNELLKLLPKRNINGIRMMASNLKIHIRNKKEWTQDEINIVYNAQNKLTLSQTLELLPNRTLEGLKHFANENKIKFKRPTAWTDKEDQLLISKCDGNISLKEIYKLFPDKNERLINNRIHKLGLRNMVTSHFKEWTKEEDKFLIDNYYNMKSKDLAEILKVSACSITDRAKVLGLNKKCIQKPYSDEEIKLLETIRDECLSLSEICNLLPHRTIPSLRHILKKMQIKYNKEDYYSNDGVTKLKSVEERDIFDFIKDNFNVDITLSNRKKFKNDKHNERYIPDYIVHSINGIKLNKKLIIEYYGLYNLINPSGFIQEYIDKTHRKNEYYKSNSDIYFIDLYPADLKNNFEGVRNKLTSFFMEKFNVNLLDLKEVFSL